MSNEEIRSLDKKPARKKYGVHIPQPPYKLGTKISERDIEAALQRIAAPPSEAIVNSRATLFPQANAAAMAINHQFCKHPAFQEDSEPINWGDKIEITRDEIQKNLATPSSHDRQKSSSYYPRTINALDWGWSMIVHAAALVFVVYFAVTAFELVPFFAQLMAQLAAVLRSMVS